MLSAEEARSLTKSTKVRRSHQGMIDRIEMRIRGAVAAGSTEVVIDLQGNEIDAVVAEQIADVVRNDGYAVRVQFIKSQAGYRMTISWA